MITISITKKTFLLVLCLVALSLIAAECTSSQEQEVTEFVDTQQAWYNKYQPPTFYTFSLERAVVKQIYDARNEARSTYSFTFSMTGDILFGCPSRGFPIPYGVQLTNPERKYPWSGYDAVVPQAEPNGLYSTGITTAATWYLCNRTQGVAPVYTEPDVMSFPFPVREVDGRLYDIEDAPSSVTIDVNRPADIPTEGPDDLPSEIIVK